MYEYGDLARVLPVVEIAPPIVRFCFVFACFRISHRRFVICEPLGNSPSAESQPTLASFLFFVF